MCGTIPYTRIFDDGRLTIRCNNSKCNLRMDMQIKDDCKYFISFDEVIEAINNAVDKWNTRT